MKIEKPVVDYREFRIHKLNTDQFRHLKLLLFWPVFGVMFLFVERFYQVDSYYVVYCKLDDYIPFQEWFVIPYLFWFVFLVGMHLYTLLYDIEVFRKLMRFIILTYGVTIILYLLFPTCQELRPVAFDRDNVLTRFMAGFYQFDTNTNVCPSLHVIGSVAAMFAAWHSKHFSTTKWKVVSGITAVLICLSTVFLKQHSILDVVAAIPICVIAYFITFYHKRRGEQTL